MPPWELRCHLCRGKCSAIRIETEPDDTTSWLYFNHLFPKSFGATLESIAQTNAENSKFILTERLNFNFFKDKEK